MDFGLNRLVKKIVNGQSTSTVNNSWPCLPEIPKLSRVELGLLPAFIDRPLALVRDSDSGSPTMVELDNSHFRKLFSADFTPKYRLTVAQDKIIVRHQGGDKALKTFSQAFDPQREGVSRSVLDGVFSFRCIAPWDVSRLACQVVHTGSRATVYTAAVEVRGLPIGQVGLFAGRDIRAGEVVGLYSGQVEVYNRPLGASDDDYAWAVQIKEPSHYLTDLPTERSKHLRVRGGIARNELAHVNHSSNPNLISIQVSDGRHPYIAFLSPMDIPQHSHLTIDYGKGYWLDRRISPVDMAGVEPKPIEAPFSV